MPWAKLKYIADIGVSLSIISSIQCRHPTAESKQLYICQSFLLLKPTNTDYVIRLLGVVNVIIPFTYFTCAADQVGTAVTFSVPMLLTKSVLQ